ncbi:tRNA pseudouridine(38-40) synthase TruA [Chlamydia ibidis]|uniref:tRNA pseudouridine(38-40) synthase TruA n=1 Tax=Chlamydia ibidis TaxID=1405396 RepID=UPI000550497E|nr:tRNA pseudouridine(38-40) synthase TruA [Chlamydia ibidis]
MGKIVLLLAYQGTKYSGWQRQPNAPTIQETIENSLSKVLKYVPSVVASGRTDAGVHAYGQVAHMSLPKHSLFQERGVIKKTLNSILPKDIVVRDVAITDNNFHSRFQAIAKEYRYVLSKSFKPLPWQQTFVYNPRHRLNIDLMRAGAQYLIGTHDFASFANHGRDYSSTIRTLFHLDIIDTEETVTVICRGNGFLYKMVRNIVGSLLDVSKGKYPPEYIAKILTSKNRRKGPPAAPGYGLLLHHVCYPYPYNWFCSSCCGHNSQNEGK